MLVTMQSNNNLPILNNCDNMPELPASEVSPFASFVHEITDIVDDISLPNYSGSVVEVGGNMVKVCIPRCRIGQECHVHDKNGVLITRGEIIGFDGDTAILSLYGSTVGLSRDAVVVPKSSIQNIGVGEQLLGRILNGFGELSDIKTKGRLSFDTFYPLMASAPDPMKRQRIAQPFSCWDTFLLTA